jgi:hypothetical protein
VRSLAHRCGRGCLALGAVLLAPVAGAQVTVPPPTPEPTPEAALASPAGVTWSELRFLARKFFLTASATIRVERVPSAELAAHLRTPPGDAAPPLPEPETEVVTVTSDLPFGRGEIARVWLDPGSGAAIQADKLSSGGSAYSKIFRFTDEGVYTWRRAPANRHEASLPPSAWSHRKEYLEAARPRPPAGMPVTDPYALLYLVSRAHLERPGALLSLHIVSQGRLVELTFVPEGLRMLATSFHEVWPGGRAERKGMVLVRAVEATARVVGGPGSASDVDLGFLGMRGDLLLYLEADTGLPVELTGRTESIGRLTVRLDRVVLRSWPPGPAATATPTPEDRGQGTGTRADQPPPGESSRL